MQLTCMCCAQMPYNCIWGWHGFSSASGHQQKPTTSCHHNHNSTYAGAASYLARACSITAVHHNTSINITKTIQNQPFQLWTKHRNSSVNAILAMADEPP